MEFIVPVFFIFKNYSFNKKLEESKKNKKTEIINYKKTFGFPPASFVAITNCTADSQTVFAVSSNSRCFSEPPRNLDANPIAQSASGSARLANLITFK